jgi:sugar O-acyltransferase (sialic acid O-acetyltransferase NeuD family)
MEARRKKWYLYGASGLGVETMDILCEAISLSGDALFDCEFLDDNPTSESQAGFAVINAKDAVAGSCVTIAVGEPYIRQKLYEKLTELALHLASVISPKSHISGLAMVGDGAIIAPFCSVQATARIGKNVAVNTASIIGHDVVVGDNAVLASMVNLGGDVSVGAQAFVGMGALVKQGVSIGESSIVGMGSVVYNDVPDGMIALGNPARVVRRNEHKKIF